MASDDKFLVWRRFVESGRPAEGDADIVAPIIMESWQRCAIRLNPFGRPKVSRLKEPLLATLLQTQEELISTAVPYLEEIQQMMGKRGDAFILTDRTGCVLLVSGGHGIVAHVKALGLGPGAYWSEGQMGTNAVAVALKTAGPVVVKGAEHYFAAYHELTTMAAPVMDTEGRLVGLLGVVGIDLQAELLPLVTSVAWAISNQLQFEFFRDRANHYLTEIQSVVETVEDGVIVWDGEERIRHLNERAAQILLLSSSAVIGQRLSQVLGLPKLVLDAVRLQRHLSMVEVEIGVVNERIIAALVSLRPIMMSPSEHFGYVMLLRPSAGASMANEPPAVSWTLEQLPAVSSAMRQTLRQIRPAVRGKAPILLTGEGGVGKSRFGRAIHNGSERGHGPFISMSCRAVANDRMVEELLGSEKGAGGFGRPGKVELAHGGTLLLGQVESLSLEAQSALLHVIETGYLMRSGSAIPVPVDVRIIGTTSANLEQYVTDGRFLRSLFYSWSIFNIRIPPLRECLEDIPFLVEQFLTRAGERLERPIWIEEEAMAVLSRYPWPGNGRELDHALERAVFHNQDGWITAMDLPEVVRNGRVMVTDTLLAQPLLSVEEAEREAIIRAGFAFEGNIGEMVDYLGMSRTTLWRRLKEMHITAEHFKS